MNSQSRATYLKKAFGFPHWRMSSLTF